MQRNLRLGGAVVSAMRRYMESQGFVDVWTPLLTKATPEGARDFVVPSRLQPGKFYALPQSPQIAKQLLVTSGFERYYQIARCFRDEDLRADRLQELTQLDVEMAFPDVELIIELMEKMVREIWAETIDVQLETPFPRMTYAESMLRYGTDKPDLRFGLEIEDATELTRSSQFKVFADAPAVRYLTVPQEYSRADLEKLEAFAKEWGAKGLAYIVYGEDGEPRSPIAKFLSEDELAAFRADPGSTVLFGADEPERVARVLGALRTRLGEELGLVDEGSFRWVWIVDFPMFEWSEEERWGAVHHPFTRPTPESEAMLEKDPGRALAVAYDLVGNGEELGGGSLRIHEPDLQAKVFSILQITPEQQQARFGFLLEALGMGAPPHGGIAFGIDRMLMVLAGEPNLRDTVAFPKNQVGFDPMSGAPSEVPTEQLDELGVRPLPPKEKPS
jgi:aspartyl-tRNA synthetase